MRFTKLDNGVLRADDESGSTNLVTVTAGENLTANDMVYISVGAADGGRTSGQAYKLDATNDNRIEFVGVVTATATSGNPVIIQVSGDIDGFTGLNVGKPIYASVTVPGSYQASAPNTSGQWMIQLGVASSATNISINAAGSATAIKISSESEITDLNDVNYIGNPNGTLDISFWSAFNTTFSGGEPQAITAGSAKLNLNRTTSNVLRGIASLQMDVTDATGSAGHGVISDEFTIDNGDLAKNLLYGLEYRIVANPANVDTSGTSTHTIEMWVYNVGLAKWTQPSNFRGIDSKEMFAPAITEFQTDSSNASNKNKYRVAIILRNAPAGTFQLNFGNVRVGPQSKNYGVPVTDFVSYTPTLSNLGTGSTTSNAARWRRVGDSMEIYFSARKDGSTGTGGTAITVTLPSGYTIDTAKLPDPAVAYANVLGSYVSASTAQVGSVVYNNTVSFAFYDNSGYFTGSDWDASEYLTATLSVPISGWSSNTIVSSSANTRAIAAEYYGTGSTVTNAGDTVIVYNTKVLDDVSAYDMGTGRYNVKVPGRYRVSASFETAAITSGAVTSPYTITIKKNGNTEALQNWPALITASVARVATISSIINANAGDYIEIVGSQQLVAGAQALSSSNRTRMSINLIQGPSQISASEVVAWSGKHTTGGSIGTSSTIINFATETVDTHGAYSGGTFTAPAPGLYEVNALISFASASWTVATSYALRVLRNGSTDFINDAVIQRTATQSPQPITISCLVNLNSGDTLEIAASQSETGAGRNLIASGAYNFASIKRLGGVG